MSNVSTQVTDAADTWCCGRFEFNLARPLIMGIVNVTPDSFSDGGRYPDLVSAVTHARRLIDEGADLIDIGGESTRPDAAEISLGEELRRVLPVVDALSDVAVALSIDTSKAEVMRAVLPRGVSIVNDVRALSLPGALDVVAESQCGVVLMHMQGTPQTMQLDPRYGDVTTEVGAFLRDRCGKVEAAGIARERIAIDPGFGFGKTNEHNYELLARLGELTALGRPLLVGISRKGMLKYATGRSVGERAMASAAAALIAVERGARIVRVHDVAATRDALAVWQATRKHVRGKA
ncbi:MAG TPA: dihydropteroate synthase [Burkholderiaceae bacterium]|nr:dihydropteroate synthase [Burkholderiaceae bacterium]